MLWKALDVQGNLITTVIAEDVEEATAAAERFFYHRSWVMGGWKVVTEEHLEQAMTELRFRYKCWQALWTSEQVRLAAEKASPDLFELGKRLVKNPDLEWEYRMALVKLVGDLW